MKRRQRIIKKNNIISVGVFLAMISGIIACFAAAICSGDVLTITLSAVAVVLVLGGIAVCVILYVSEHRVSAKSDKIILSTLPADELNALSKLSRGDEIPADRIAQLIRDKFAKGDRMQFSNTMFAAGMALSRDIFWQITENGGYLNFGSYWEDTYGYTALEDAKNIEQLLHLETQVEFRRAVQSVREVIGSTFSIMGKMKIFRSKHIMVNIVGASTMGFGETVVLGVCREVETEARLNRLLDGERIKSQFLANTAADTAYEANADEDTLKILNPEVSRQIFNYGDMRSFDRERRPYWEQIHPDYREGFIDRFFNYDHLLVLPEHTLSYEYRVKNSSGDYIWVLHKVKVIEAVNGSVVRVIGSITNINDKKRREIREQYRSKHDSLTGTLLKSALREDFGNTNNHKGELAVVAFNINRFRHINNHCGHEVGDKVLRALVNVLWSKQCGACSVGRTGSDTFVILMFDAKGANGDPEKQMQLVLEAFTQPIKIGSELINITISAGATYAQASDSFDEAYRRAELALHEVRVTNPAYSNAQGMYDPSLEQKYPDFVPPSNEQESAIAERVEYPSEDI